MDLASDRAGWWFTGAAEGIYCGAAVGPDDSLLGYADVSAGASKLSFQVRELDMSSCANWGTPEVLLYSAAHVDAIAPDAEGNVQSCAGCTTGEWVAWTAVSFDVSGLVGQRIVIRAIAGYIGACWPDVDQSVAIEDFRFE